jgi:hypothetical protein
VLEVCNTRRDTNDAGHAIVTIKQYPGPLAKKDGASIELWRVGTWYHWMVQVPTENDRVTGIRSAFRVLPSSASP